MAVGLCLPQDTQTATGTPCVAGVIPLELLLREVPGKRVSSHVVSVTYVLFYSNDSSGGPQITDLKSGTGLSDSGDEEVTLR